MRGCAARLATLFLWSLVLGDCLLGTWHEGSKGHDFEGIKGLNFFRALLCLDPECPVSLCPLLLQK